MIRTPLCILLFTVMMLSHAAGRASDIPQEFVIKAKYLLNIPNYTELPGNDGNSSFTICLIGNTPLESLLAAASGRLIKNRPLVVKRVENLRQIDSCQLLFVASSERNRLQALLPEAQRRGILTVSDMRDFTRLGGMINLKLSDNRITFDINLAAARKAAISFSTHLLKLAHDIMN